MAVEREQTVRDLRRMRTGSIEMGSRFSAVSSELLAWPIMLSGFTFTAALWSRVKGAYHRA